ncbi:MAG: transposase [Verrucomicrobiales bacterium]|nr:transposase [Verrucomicrobiales bacterium]
MRPSLERGEPLNYVVRAWVSSNRQVLGQLKVSENSNEFTAVPELLRALDLAGCIVTLNAMGCLKKCGKRAWRPGRASRGRGAGDANRDLRRP